LWKCLGDVDRRFPPGPITKLPQELVIAIVSYFIYDTCTLLACSLTCYQWYIAAASHLHHSLTTDNYHDGPGWPPRKFSWPNPLRKSYKLGLLPLVIRFRIRLGTSRWDEVTPKWLSGPTLRYFSALTNLQELGIDRLQLSDFMPTIQQCFGHFSPTLRFLALKEPNGSSRQILYLIGLFPNLQDLKLSYRSLTNERKNADSDAALVPLSTH
jgi:F-box-like